jgi:predicted ATPase
MAVSRSTQPQSDTRPALPAPAGLLFGRQDELRALARLLSEPGPVTLTGLGGSGKTALALRLAHDLSAAFAGRVWWCDLSPLTDPALVPYTVAAALGLADSQAPIEAAQRFIGAAPGLLVLDNCEHVAAAAADLLHALMTACPGLRALATSLQPLGTPGEQTWRLGSLPVPAPNASLDQAGYTRLAEQPAIALFVARAKASAPAFELNERNAPLIAGICRRLEGLPLAIELAAARAGILSLEQILSHLDNSLALLDRAQPLAGGAARHRALRATLAWGYHLLTPDEQCLFRSLSVFSGSFTLESAAGVARAFAPTDIADSIRLDLLSGLVDKSMLVVIDLPARGLARYRMLEPVRIYARELLEAAGEGPATRDRQLDWAVALAETLAPQLIGAQAGAAITQVEADYDTLRAALRWSITSRQIEPGMRLAATLFRFWFNRGPLSEGRAWAEELLNAHIITNGASES